MSLKRDFKTDIVRLHTPKGVRQFLVELVNRVKMGDITESQARSLGYLCQLISINNDLVRVEKEHRSLKKKVKVYAEKLAGRTIR